MKVTTIGIDQPKNVIQVHGVDERGKVVLRKLLKHSQIAAFFGNLPYQRWVREGNVKADSRPLAAVAVPANKLCPEERARVTEVCHTPDPHPDPSLAVSSLALRGCGYSRGAIPCGPESISSAHRPSEFSYGHAATHAFFRNHSEVNMSYPAITFGFPFRKGSDQRENWLSVESRRAKGPKTIPNNLTLSLLFASTLFVGSYCQAATYYVDAARPNDTDAGTSWATAKKTIKAGVALLSSGDTLKIKTGTYAEAVSVASKYFSTTTRIETDDGAGNPGIVTITGSATCVDVNAVVCFANAGFLTWDGRQSETEGQPSYGFILHPTATANGMRVNEYSTNDTVKIFRTKVLGTKVSDDFGSFHIGYVGNIEIGYNKIAQTDGNTGDCIIVFSAGTTPTPPNTTGGSIHHNDVSCNPSNGYGAITQKRTNDVNVYNNYIHDIGNGGVGIILRDQSMVGPDGSEVYNNTIVNNTNMRTGIQVRGFSTGTGGTDNARIYNNTLVATVPFSDGVFFNNDPSDGNKFYNNLIIGNVSSFVSTWGQYQGTNNEMYNNYVTGTVTKWFATVGLEGMFPIKVPNYSNQPRETVPTDVGASPYNPALPVPINLRIE